MLRFLFVILFVFFMLPVQAKFSNEPKLAVIQTAGNSVVKTYNAKILSLWERDKSGNGDKIKVESAQNWDINANG